MFDSLRRRIRSVGSDRAGNASLEAVLGAITASAEIRQQVVKALVAGSSLPDLKAVIPQYYATETTDYGEAMTVFRAEGDADFDLLESMIHRYRYYDVPNVWGARIDLDKRVTAAIAHGLGGPRCLELGCFTGPVISILADRGTKVTGLDMSHFAFTFAYPNVRDRMVYGDLLSAKLEGRYDVLLAMDFFEHLNPVKLGSYFERLAALVADDGYVYVNSPMFGADDVFGVVFPPYLKEWSAVEDRGFWRHLDCDSLGWPKHGHLVWAMPSWWERSFRQAGLVRDRAVETAIHRRLDKFFEIAPARKCLFVLKREGNQADPDRISRAVIAAIDAIDEPV